MDYYQILGVSRNCDRQALHKAFRELSKQNHPDRFSDADRSKAEQRYKEIVIAFNTLKDQTQRQKYDAKLKSLEAFRGGTSQSSLQAQKFFNAGTSRAKQGQWEQAIDFLQRSLKLKQEAETYFQLALAESKVDKHRKAAVDNFNHAISMNPAEAKYRVHFIKALQTFGLPARARANLEKALEKFPHQTELQDLAQELLPKKDGFLGGIFGK